MCTVSFASFNRLKGGGILFISLNQNLYQNCLIKFYNLYEKNSVINSQIKLFDVCNFWLVFNFTITELLANERVKIVFNR